MSPAVDPLLQISDLRVTLPGPSGAIDIIRGVDMRVESGEIVGLAGESGSGKSLTSLTLLNLLPPGAVVTGSIMFDGRELIGQDDKSWRRVRGSEIAMVFQDSSAALHPMLPIGTQLTEHMRQGLGLSRQEARARAVDLLDRVRIPQAERVLKAYPHQFSGGMRQRIAIAIALACRPKLLIADEPTTALDVTVQAGILALLDELRAEGDLSVLFITHDLGVLASLTRRSYLFYAGRVMESGPTAQMLTAPEHPYTAALLAARPHGLGSGQTLKAIPGSPVVPGYAPPGCPFEPRCGFAIAACNDGLPPVLRTSETRELACIVAPNLERHGV